MRTVINGENVYCAGSGRSWSGLGTGWRAVCPVCGDAVILTRGKTLRVHFAPYRVGADGLRDGDAS